MDFKQSLTSGDKFAVSVEVVRESRVRFAFHQNIHRLGDEKQVLQAKVVATALNVRGRPDIPEELQSLLCMPQRAS